MTAQKHVHKFTKTKEIKVMPHPKSRLSFVDKLKQLECKCGLIVTVDLERIT